VLLLHFLSQSMQIEKENHSEMLKMLKMLRFLTLIFVLILFSGSTAFGQCSIETEWTFDPPVPPSGAYDAGTVLTLCGEVTAYTSGGANWLSGMAIVFPPAWDAASITNIVGPTGCGTGEWVYLETLTCGGLVITNPGFYYDSNVAGPQDGNPCNNWGDGSNPCGGWSFCFDVTLDAECGGGTNPFDGTDITPAIQAYSDSEVGSWGTGTGCASAEFVDGPIISIDLDCCDAESGEEPAGPVNICGNTPFNLLTLLGPPIDAGGAWTGPAGWTVDGIGNPIFNPSTNPNLSDPAGDYTYEVTGSDGCLKTSTITMQFIDLGLQSTNSLCSNSLEPLIGLWNNAAIPLLPGGTWTFPDGTVVPGGVVDPASDPSGIYTYNYVDAGGCPTTISMLLNISPGGGVVFPANDITVCLLDPPFAPYDSLLGVPASLSGSWIYYGYTPPPAPDDFLIFSGTGGATTWALNPADYNNGAPMVDGYVIYYSNDPACGFAQDTIFINVGEVFDAGLFTSPTICEGDAPVILESLLLGTPTIGGDWEDINGNPVANLYNPAAVVPDSTYTLIYSGGFAGTSCFNSQVMQLTVLSNFTDAGNPMAVTVCETQLAFSMTDTLNETGTPQPGGIWTGPPGFGGGEFFVPGSDPAGVYTYTISSPCGSDSNTLTINVITLANAGIDGTLNICPADLNVPLINGLGGAPQGGGFWTLSGIPVVPPTVNGNTVADGAVYQYSVGTGTCADFSEVTISLQPGPFAGVLTTVPQEFCQTDASFSLNTLFTTPPSVLGDFWTGPLGPVAGSTFNPATAGSGNYTYTATNSCGSDDVTIFISIETSPNAGNSGPLVVCDNGTVSIDLFASLGAGVTTGGTWTGPAGWTLTGGNPIFDPTSDPAGAYTYTVQSLPNNLCTATATINVSYIATGDAGLDNTIAACGTDATFNMLDSLNGTPDGGGDWFPSGPLFNPTLSAPIAYTYLITNPGCSSSISTLTVNLQSPPDAGQNTVVTLCESLGNIDLTAELNGTPVGGGVWTDLATGTTVSNPYNLAGSCGSSVSLEYTVEAGICISSSTLDMTIQCPPNAGANVATTQCADNSGFDLFSILDPTADAGSFTNTTSGLAVPGGIVTLSAGAAGSYTYTVPGGQCPDDIAFYTLNLQTPISVVLNAQCTPSQTQYVVTLTVTGGDGNYTVTGLPGGPFVGNTYVSAPIAAGSTYSFSVDDTGPCAPFVQAVTPSPNCACAADAEFVDTSVAICEGGTANIELNFPSGAPTFTIDYTDGTNIFTNQGPFISGDFLQVTPATTTVYTLTGVNDQNCSTSVNDVVTVTVETTPDAGPDVPALDFCGSGGVLVLSSIIDAAADQPGIFTNSGGTVVATVPQISASSGTYIYTVSGTQCPNDAASYTLNIIDPITVNVVSAVCNLAQTAYTVTLEISGGDGSYVVTNLAGSLNTSVSPAVFTSNPITTGTPYSYTVSDTGPCPDVVAGPINSPNCSCPASANFVDGSISICQGSTANIELNFPSGSPTFTIDYSDGTNTFTNQGPYVSGDFLQVTPATTTTYTLTGVADQNCNTSASDAITVVVEAPPIAGPDVIEAFCASNAAFNLSTLVDGAVASTTGDFFDSGGVQVPGNTINLNSSSSDVYTYEVSATVCPSDQALYTITINDPIAISNILVECNSAQTGYIVSFDIEGGDGNYAVAAGGSYAGTILPGSPVSYESALIPNDTDYSFTISDGSPCSDQIVGGLDPDCDCPAAVSLTGTTAICNGDCATLSFNLEGDGPWDVVYENSLDSSNPISLIDIANGHMVTVCPSATATYTILSVDDVNCSGLVNGLPVTVTVDSPLSVNNLTETCDAVNENYTVSFTVNGGIPGTYQVNPFGQSFVGGVYQSFPISSGSPYSFTVSDAGACASVLVEGVFQCVCITDAGSIAPGLIEICEDENLIIPFNGDDVLDGNDGYQFILHEGSETNIGFIVDRYTAATISTPNGIVFGQTYYITGVAGNTDPFGNVILTEDCANQTNGIPVIFHALPSALISGFGTICPGEAVDITVSLTGVGPWIFEYAINAAPQTPVSTTDNEYVFPTTTAGNYTLLSVSDANCDGSVSGLVQVSNFATPTAVLSGDGDVCENSGDGPLVNLTGQAPWTIFYSIDGVENTDPITTFNNQFTIPAEEDGNYTLTLLSDANCVGTVSGVLDVTILTAPTALISGGGTVCEGDELPFEVELTGDGPWSFIYTIDGIPQPSITTSGNSYIFSSAVSGDYIITQVNDQSCSGEALDSDAALIVNLLPTAEVLSNQDQICIGQELELIYDLQGTPPFTLTYLLNEDTITLTGLTTDYLEVLQPTTPVFTQVLYVEDSSNPVCFSTPNNSKFIPVGELPDAPILQDDTICSDAGSVLIGLDGVPELEYTWSPADRLSDPKDPNPTFILGDDDFSPFVRQYTFILTASNGDCVADDTLTITVDPGPTARFTYNPNPVNSEDTKVRFLNQSSTGDEAIYFWEFDSLDTSQEFNPVYEFPGGVLANYTVTLTVIDPLIGCIDEWSDIIKVKPEMLVYVPTAFTPDNDGLNDLWKPVLSNIDENDYLLSVFDRFGNIVFETRNPNKSWNGSMQGDDYYVKTGLYVWQIETKNPLSLEKVDFKGTVTVIR
jgi:gliding motility-associated-like protein